LIKKRRFPEVYFGWWTLLVTSIWTGLGFSYYSFGISVLFKPICDDLGLNRATASLATGIGGMEGGIEAPITGWLSDKYGPRWVIITGIVLMGTGLVLMNFINSLWSYILVWGILIGLSNNLAFTLANDKFITNWFVRKRGLAFAIRFMFMAGGGVVLIPIVSWLVATQGWRMTNVIWGIIIFAALPLTWYFVKPKRPEYYGLLPDGTVIEAELGEDASRMIDRGIKYAAEVQEVEFTLRQTLRTTSYWLLATGYAAGAMAQLAVNVHLIPFLTDMGIGATAAGGMMAMMIFFQIPARFLSGLICDRLRIDRWRFLLAGAILLEAIGIIIIILNQSIAMLYVFLILFGFGSGAVLVVRIMIEGRYFGRKAFASIHGCTNLLNAPIGLVAPIFAGWIYDASGNYIIAFLVLAVITTVGAFLTLFIRPPKPPAEVSTDVSKFM
jgi:MFS family permease